MRCNELLFVLGHDSLREQLRSVAFALSVQDLMILAQLLLVIINGLAQVLSHGVAILDVVQLLQTVDRDGEYLSRAL